MDTPGAYENRATEAFYYVTPPEKEWDAKHKEEHLRLYNKPVMDIITVHEAFPGHYTRFIYANQFPTRTRKLYSCGSNAEGWAHYTEQMMLEEGFGGGDKLRIVAAGGTAIQADVSDLAHGRFVARWRAMRQAANGVRRPPKTPI